MAEKADKDQKLQSHVSGESVKVISEAVGITGLPEPAANYLAEDCTYRLKMMVQVCQCLTGASCSKLMMSLVNDSLKFQMAILQIHCYF